MKRSVTRCLKPLLLAWCLLSLTSLLSAQDDGGGQQEARADANVLTIADALRLAIERNPSIASARLEIEARRAALAGQRGRWLPTLTADASARIQQSLARPINVGGGTIVTAGQTSETSDVALTLRQTFYQSGIAEAIDSAHEQVAVSELGLADARRRLLVQVAATFSTILADQLLVDVAEQAVSAAELHLQLVDARIDAGTAAPADRLPVEVELADARYGSVSAANAVWQAIADLRALLALPPDELPLIRGTLEITPEDTDLTGWIERAMANRPDLEAQRRRVRLAELSVRQARIDGGLTLQASGQADYGRHTGTTGETWALMAGVSYPLFNGPARANIEQAKANLEAARQGLAEMELAVAREVSRAWYGLDDASQRVEMATVSLAAATTNLEAARARYAEQVGTIVEVTDAELSWRRAGVQLVQSRFDRSIAYYQLLAASGALELPLPPEADESGTVIEP